MADLRTRVGALELRSPLLLASGIWGESGVSLRRAYDAGAGAVVSKSIGSEPRDGYPNPTIEEYGSWGLLNAMGLPNPGMVAYRGELAAARQGGAVVIGSIFGHDASEFRTLALAMAETGVAALELNLSCPHAEGLGSEIGGDPTLVTEITRAVKEAVPLPVWAKITPNAADPAALAVAAVAGGADAITAINTVRAMAIDVDLQRPVLTHGLGGLSGPAVKPIGLAVVWQIYERVQIPIVGVGGISTVDDALQYLLAGASAVQIGTAITHGGAGLFSTLNAGISHRLDELKIPSVTALIGAAHRGTQSV
ncbi:MAG: dihydroorotate dehydrogenase [Thermoplasmata archaeon]|nr:dihydroorotate dehydrogenase [Thermoplasmata archaeon]